MAVLRISVDHETPVRATGAKVQLSIAGNSAVLGDAAVKKAAEVRDLTMELFAAGIGEDAITVTGVRLSSESGMIGKSQKADYQLCVQATPSQLPTVLSIIGEQPNATLWNLEWVFPDFEASIPASAEAVAKARRKAEAIAEAAGLSIVGIAELSDSWSMPGHQVDLSRPDVGVMRALTRARGGPVDLGVELSSTRNLRVHLSVDFELA
ncbi:MAG: SIMPL domain-containing protein [Propionibacteriaceae bacterium]|nr:SIMPL domain-containing protein [Propionibacteriaceae bacterium]